MSATPTVSIITATYNRSNVLRYAIGSALRQTLGDWELIVVGDACTDDTAAVVASFGDPRISFFNLETNVGEQSGPNNEGFRRSRGRYVAYLSHDDLWLPDHLETLVSRLERTDADLVFALTCCVQKEGPGILAGVTPTGGYEPYVGPPASSWLLRRELAEEVGPWLFCRKTYLAPSQEWLYRAWKRGKRLQMVPKVTTIAIQSGSRPGSYSNREEAEHVVYFRRMVTEPSFLETELTRAALGHAIGDPVVGAQLSVRPYVVRAVKNLLRSIVVLAGRHPGTVRALLSGLRKGAFIDRLRQIRGLPPLPMRRTEP